jgi:hypothetical protein
MSRYRELQMMRHLQVSARRVLLSGPYALSVRGSALVGVMAIITAVLLVGIAIFILGHSEGDVVEYAVDDSRAFYIAEGGLERARAYLTALEESDPNANPVGTTFSGQSLGGGIYDVAVVADANPGGTVDAYDVVSTGAKDGVLRQVKATMVAETFAIYQWFIGSVGGGYSWFRTGERFEGPVHVNGNLGIDGDPWFGGVVHIAGNHITETVGSNPTFVRGYELEVDPIPLPSRNEVLATLRAQADDGGFRPGPLGPNKAYWEVTLDGETFSFEGFDKNGNPLTPGTTGVPFAAYNGAFWFDDDIHIKGTLDGQVTIGVDGNVHIVDDIVYADSTPGSGPDDGCDDILGVIAAGQSEGNIIIDYNVPNSVDCEVHGVFMALQNTIEAEEYQHHGPRGEFIIYGGLMAQSAIHLAQMDGGVVTNGYVRNYNYDSRVLTLPPPFFPFSSNFALVTWEEIVPVQTS